MKRKNTDFLSEDQLFINSVRRLSERNNSRIYKAVQKILFTLDVDQRLKGKFSAEEYEEVYRLSMILYRFENTDEFLEISRRLKEKEHQGSLNHLRITYKSLKSN